MSIGLLILHAICFTFGLLVVGLTFWRFVDAVRFGDHPPKANEPGGKWVLENGLPHLFKPKKKYHNSP